ncbi:uncharacterized protein LOC141909538 [Tubulanus polymorphus]|uniref:uncharacterized protein LOC141909538 n=1 Tax=Tubulanus polymorphus TaxID=672921 RepID=UPI003DA69E11
MLLLEGVEVHVREDAFKSCLRRHMDWLDELVIDADDNTWFRWMSRRQTKDQRRGQMNQMSGDGGVMYIGTSQSKTGQKRRFEVQSRTRTIAQNVLKAVKRRRGSAAVQGALPQQRVQSQTMTAVGQQPIGLLPETINSRRSSTAVLDSTGCEILSSVEIESTSESIKKADDESDDSTNLNDSNVDAASMNQNEPNVEQSSESGLSTTPPPAVSSWDNTLEQLESIIGSSPSFEQLELFSGATNGEKVDLKCIKNESIKIEPVEILSGSDDDEGDSSQPIVQRQQHEPQPGTSSSVNHTGVGYDEYNVPCELLPSVELKRLPAGKVDAQGRFKIATGYKRG